MYKLKKLTKTVSPTGFNPLNWGMELCAKLIHRERKKNTADSTLSNWRLNPLARQENVELPNITINASELKNAPDTVKAMLRKYGVCLINDFISEGDALAASTEMQNFFNGDSFANARNSSEKGFGKEAHYIWQTDYAWSDNYIEVVKADKPLVNIRARDENVDDAGMVDIFNVQKLTVNAELKKTQACLEAMNSQHVQTLLSEHSGYSLRQSNLYHNKSVTRTRGPHIDNNSDPYKLFLYLTDVQEEHNGPYCYLPCSPKDRSYMTIERLRNAVLDLPSTEVSSFPRENMTKLFGKAGTAIITNQSGIHCGWPQTEDGERMLLVSNYY